MSEERDRQKLFEELARDQDAKMEGKALSFWKKSIYSSGNLPAAMTIAMIDTWIIFFYSEQKTVYVSAMVAGILNFLRYICNAIGDPTVGWWSDRTKSRWGRRRPFILFGTPMLAVLLVLAWFPPVQGQSWVNVAVLGFYLLAFGFLYPVVVNPYLSLLPEITPYIKERINLSALMGYGEVAGRIIAQVAAGFAITYFNKHPAAFLGVALDGYKIMAIIAAVITVAIYMIMVFQIKETPGNENKEVPYGIFQAVAEVFKNPTFIPYIVVIAGFILASNMLIIITPFFGKAIMGVNEDTSGLLLGILLLVAALFFPLTAWAGGKVGKKTTFVVSMFWFAIFSCMFPLIKLIPGLDPKIFGFVIYFLVAPPVASVLVLQRPMISDVIDYDEKLTGFRRESMYMGAEGMITKLAWGVSFLIAPFMMSILGKTADNPWGILLNGPAAGFLLFLCTLYFWRKYQFKR